MIDKLLCLLGTKFVGFLLTGVALLVALCIGKVDGPTFVDGLIWLFGIFAGGNVVATSAGVFKDAMVAKSKSE